MPCLTFDYKVYFNLRFQRDILSFQGLKPANLKMQGKNPVALLGSKVKTSSCAGRASLSFALQKTALVEFGKSVADLLIK